MPSVGSPPRCFSSLSTPDSHTGTFPAEMGRNLRRIFDLRQMADYSGTDLTTEAVQDVIDRAASFVDAVESHLDADTEA